MYELPRNIEDEVFERLDGPVISPMNVGAFLVPFETYIEQPPRELQSLLPYEQEEVWQNMIANGHMPKAGHGFAFVTDHRPEGKENDPIPADEFTRYFSEGKIPIADKDHKYHRHDLGHISSYITAFSCEEFASLVRETATIARDDPELCRTFAGAIDGFGDGLRNIENELAIKNSVYLGDINAIGFNLRKMLTIKKAAGIEIATDDETALIRTIEKKTGVSSARFKARNDFNDVYESF